MTIDDRTECVNFLADESVDGPIVKRLRADNHSVVYMAEWVHRIVVVERMHFQAAASRDVSRGSRARLRPFPRGG